MCTVVVLYRPDHPWPLLIAANRDEMENRPWQGPARHWPDRDFVVAGIDEMAGGTWFGINDDGVVAAVLNRMGTLGPKDGYRSRGELPLEALDHSNAQDAAKALSNLEATSYRAFNLVVADRAQALLILSTGEDIHVQKIPYGVSMITAYGMNDANCPRTQHHLPRFMNSPVPDPDNDDWFAWATLLGDQGAGQTDETVMNINFINGFKTVSSTLLALPSFEKSNKRPHWLFKNGSADDNAYKPVDLSP